MKQVQRLYSRKRCLEVSSQKYLFAIDKKLPRPPIRNSITHAWLPQAAVLVKSGKKAVYTVELLAFGGFASVVCTCRSVDCNSVIGMQFCDWNDNGATATPGKCRLLDRQGNNSS